MKLALDRTFLSRFFVGFLVVFLLGIVFYALSEGGLTGQAVSSLDIVYEEGTPLSGSLRYQLKEGEFLPADSVIIFRQGDNEQSFVLREYLDASPSEGTFYAEGASLEGFGEGYGLPGTFVVYPELSFDIAIFEEESSGSPGNSGTAPGQEKNDAPAENASDQGVDASTDESSDRSDDAPSESTDTSDTSSEPSDDESGESPEPDSSDSSDEDTSLLDVVAAAFIAPLTGRVVDDSSGAERIISGTVSFEEPFTLSLGEGEQASLVSGSVRLGDEVLADSVVTLEEEDSVLTVETTYLSEEEGYGENFLSSEDTLTFTFDLSSFALNLSEGDLEVLLISQDETLVSLSTTISPGEQSTTTEPDDSSDNETVVSPPDISNESVSSNESVFNQSIIQNTTLASPLVSSLSSTEQALLRERYPDQNLTIARAEEFNGFVVVEYLFGEFSAIHAYDTRLSEATLSSLMAADQISFLRSLASPDRERPVSSSRGELLDNSVSPQDLNSLNTSQ